MNDSPDQPRSYDAVLGGPYLEPMTAAVLGGLRGVKRQLSNESEAVRIAALAEALKYGQAGWDLVVSILKDSTGTLQWAAYEKLWEHASPDIKKKLLRAIPLASDRGVDYRRLRYFLATSQWFQAEEETRQVMLQVAHRENIGNLYIRDLEEFPLADLQTIDRLWVKYSNERFGFSVQKQIWDRLSTYAEPNYETFCRFGDRVGWRNRGNWLNRNEIIFHLGAPSGHLPHRPHGNQLSPVGVWQVFFSRLETCYL